MIYIPILQNAIPPIRYAGKRYPVGVLQSPALWVGILIRQPIWQMAINGYNEECPLHRGFVERWGTQGEPQTVARGSETVG